MPRLRGAFIGAFMINSIHHHINLPYEQLKEVVEALQLADTPTVSDDTLNSITKAVSEFEAKRQIPTLYKFHVLLESEGRLNFEDPLLDDELSDFTCFVIQKESPEDARAALKAWIESKSWDHHNEACVELDEVNRLVNEAWEMQKDAFIDDSTPNFYSQKIDSDISLMIGAEIVKPKTTITVK